MKSKKVLIVDNNDLNRKLFESLIGQFYSFEAVKNGVEAVQRASKEKFDLILMDIQMPEMDGITASKIIRRQAAHPCPIIAITAYSPESTRKCFLEMGFDDLITKPIRAKEFLAVISAKIHPNKHNDSQLADTNHEDAVLDKKVIHQLLKYTPIETIKSIYVDFLREYDQLICHIDTAFQERNIEVLIENLHTLKGNSGTLGANAIFNLSSDADGKARAQDWDSLEKAIKKLKNERIIFENYLAEETTFST
ncbi:response regulator [Algoriphagus antarcticus]|uniref:CheY-like chemotaxis protein n=1 Tax=Algoriphagus antarcticus TaxID=238540 RepID=A0A3E0DGR3_9BACT|nr:response regulator [Algoriphagus antarcticus]REG81912.1 CheY-like chemotaxis protein [Algoriphagus antarcticus]